MECQVYVKGNTAGNVMVIVGHWPLNSCTLEIFYMFDHLYCYMYQYVFCLSLLNVWYIDLFGLCMHVTFTIHTLVMVVLLLSLQISGWLLMSAMLIAEREEIA